MKKIIIILVVVITIIGISSCSKEKNISVDKPLHMYVLQNDEIIPIIDSFNKTKKQKDIVTTEFENINTLFTKLQTEIMAGKGPDLIYYNHNTNNQNMMSYMKNDVFADLNEFIYSDINAGDFNLNNYNKTVMKAGQIDDKQVYVPLTYFTDIIVTSKENCDRYNLDFSHGLSFENIDKKLSKFLIKKSKNHNICTSLPYTHFFDKLIENSIYDNKKERVFLSEKFKNNFDSIENSYVINSVMAVEIFFTTEALDKKIYIDGDEFTVCGVYECDKNIINQLSSDGKQRVYIPYTSYKD